MYQHAHTLPRPWGLGISAVCKYIPPLYITFRKTYDKIYYSMFIFIVFIISICRLDSKTEPGDNDFVCLFVLH